MKVGDFVYDSANGLHGIIVEKDIPSTGVDRLLGTTTWDFWVLYEDGVTSGADEHEIEVIYESR